MARLGRYFLADQPLHVIQRGNDREAIFFRPKYHALYRTLLGEAPPWLCRPRLCAHDQTRACAADAAGGRQRLAAYAVAGNPLCLPSEHGPSAHRHAVGGPLSLAADRERGAAVGRYRYIELNPVRVSMAAAPGDYAWSSYRIHAEGAGRSACHGSSVVRRARRRCRGASGGHLSENGWPRPGRLMFYIVNRRYRNMVFLGRRR